MPSVSVVIPTYNRPYFLRSAIKSVLDQTFQDFEIIVVDDASAENIVDVIDSFNSGKIKYIRHTVNKGLSAARNSGINASIGKYIALLDDDDEWLPEKLKVQVELLEKSLPEIGVVYTGYLMVDRASGEVLQKLVPTKKGHIFDDLMIGDCVLAGGSTALLRRECFEKAGLFDEDLITCEAYDFWIRISRIYQFEYIQDPLIKYYVHKYRLTTHVSKSIIGMELMQDKYGDIFSMHKRVNSRRYYSLGVLHCFNGDTTKGREIISKAIRMYPFDIRYYFNLVLSLFGPNKFIKFKENKDKIITYLRKG